jgi:mRNA interferase HigB
LFGYGRKGRERAATDAKEYRNRGLSHLLASFPRFFVVFVPIWDYHRAMCVIAVATRQTFWRKHPDAEQAVRAWYDEAMHASWQQPADIKARYTSASILKNRRVVFNIKGNDYRLVVAVAYQLQVVDIKFVGTHQEHDLIDAETVDHTSATSST